VRALGVTPGNTLAVPAANNAGNEQVRGYRPELDVVRFLAFLFVFIHHFLPPIRMGPYPFFASTGAESWRVPLALDEACAMGLCLFFTLSAYLITELLLSERKNSGAVSVRKFYVRRILRIWPLYFFGIAIGITLALLVHQRSDLTAFVWYLLFAGNIYCAAFGWLHNPMNPLWSISVEEQFYLLWPWAMRCFTRCGLVVCALFFLVAANITLFILGQRHVDTGATVWPNTFVQFEMFATGILLALAKSHIVWRKPGIGLALALTGPVLWFFACFAFGAKQPAQAGAAASGLELMIAYGLIALGCAAVLQGFCMMGPSHMPRWAAGLGKISYGLYVYHLLAIEFVQACFRPLHGLQYLAASALLSLLLTMSAAAISYTFLEAPFLRLKRRFEIVHTRPI
jgi:peptidoglycan/LPS O-acetylase OafA/YrhL